MKAEVRRSHAIRLECTHNCSGRLQHRSRLTSTRLLQQNRIRSRNSLMRSTASKSMHLRTIPATKAFFHEYRYKKWSGQMPSTRFRAITTTEMMANGARQGPRPLPEHPACDSAVPRESSLPELLEASSSEVCKRPNLAELWPRAGFRMVVRSPSNMETSSVKNMEAKTGGSIISTFRTVEWLLSAKFSSYTAEKSLIFLYMLENTATVHTREMMKLLSVSEPVRRLLVTGFRYFVSYQKTHFRPPSWKKKATQARKSFLKNLQKNW
mmetsp:Transcript_88787/g.264906  ORF Transcript_88787/g.264906 Transcript_88787/m.264906 type:complete len:267 (+) Transcript_88787:365-1165(+)